MEVPDGLRVELLDGELVVQANPGHVHGTPGRSLVRHTPEPFEAWNERGLLIADGRQAGPGGQAAPVRGRRHPRLPDRRSARRGQEIRMPEPMGFAVRTSGWRPYK
nr:hypothetical protein [Streptomyces sp. HNM0574]